MFGFLGLMGNPFLLFIALFVWIGAAQESSMVQVKRALGGIPLDQVMLTDFYNLEVSDSLARAVDLTLAGSQKDFPVLRGEAVVGILTQSDLMRGLKEQGEHSPVVGSMHRDFETADPGETAEGALLRLQTCDCHILLVIEDGRLVGLVNLENVSEFLEIQKALDTS